MEMSPQQVRNASFKSSRRGFDPDQVHAFLRDVAESLEAAQNQSTAMEARARAAVARLQEVSNARETPGSGSGSGDTDTISRTLVLAQRTADAAVSEAKAEAERIVTAAHQEAATTVDEARETAARLVEEARTEARQVSEIDRKAAQSEVEALLARRDFLESDVDQLERFLGDQRDRLRETASTLLDLTERAPGGLGEMRRPLLSASAEPVLSEPDPAERAGADAEPGGLPDPTRVDHQDELAREHPDEHPESHPDEPQALPGGRFSGDASNDASAETPRPD